MRALLDGLREVANATPLIANPGEHAHFLIQRQVRPWSRQQVADLRDVPLSGGVVEFLATRLAGLVLQGPDSGAQHMRRSGCGDGAIAPIEAKGLQVAVFASVLALVEHRERLRFVRLHGLKLEKLPWSASEGDFAVKASFRRS
jgi:hypothetical protein